MSKNGVISGLVHYVSNVNTVFTRYAVNTTAVEVFKRVNTAPREVLTRRP